MTTCYMDISIGGRPQGRMIFRLFNDVCPRTCENFSSLCEGNRGLGATTKKPLTYRNSIFHRIIPDFMVQGGDFSNRNGTGGESIFGGKFRDESFKIPHSKMGLLSMANAGPNTNGSQFFITLRPTPHLNGKHVVFGELIEGKNVLLAISKVDTVAANKPAVGQEVVITNCGVITPPTSKSSAAEQRKESHSSPRSGHDAQDRPARPSQAQPQPQREKRSRSRSRSRSRERRRERSDSDNDEAEEDDESENRSHKHRRHHHHHHKQKKHHHRHHDADRDDRVRREHDKR